MPQPLRVGSIADVPVRLSWSLLALAAFFTWTLSGDLRALRPGAEPTSVLAYGLLGAALFCGSILVHELGHALVARRHGLPVLGVTLWMLGGVATLGREPETPGTEAKVAAAGPMGSALCAAVFWALLATDAALFVDELGLRTGLGLVLVWLVRINVLLTIFNLFPGLPLDGGYLVAALAWRVTGSRLRGRWVAACLGVALGWAIVAWGIWQTRANQNSQLWTILGGYFIADGANRERTRVKRLLASPAPSAG